MERSRKKDTTLDHLPAATVTKASVALERQAMIASPQISHKHMKYIDKLKFFSTRPMALSLAPQGNNVLFADCCSEGHNGHYGSVSRTSQWPSR